MAELPRAATALVECPLVGCGEEVVVTFRVVAHLARDVAMRHGERVPVATLRATVQAAPGGLAVLRAHLTARHHDEPWPELHGLGS